MNDLREDQLLCPIHYMPVEAVTPSRGFTRYICSSCPATYEKHHLTSANELRAEIQSVLELEAQREELGNAH